MNKTAYLFNVSFIKILLFTILLSVPIHSQSSNKLFKSEEKGITNLNSENCTSEITFTIQGADGDLISGATVTLTNLKTKKEYEITTNEKGVAHFTTLQKGRYKIRPYYEGLEKQEIYLHLKRDIESSIKVILSPATVGAVVTFKELETPFFQATYREDLKSVKDSINRGFDVKTKDENGTTALHVAVESGNFEIIKTIFYAGANINTKNKAQQTPLMMIIETFAEDETIVKILNFLVSNGANINEINKNRETLLMLASKKNNDELVEILLKAGAGVNLNDKDGKTALTKTSNPYIKKLLKKYGAVH